jgi:hypothetical protein
MSDTAAPLPARAFRFFLREFRHVLPPTIYFFVAFNIIVVTTNLLARGYIFALANFMTATALALIVGKVVLVVDKIRAIDRFRDAPLIKPIVFKTVFYTLVVMLVRVIEQFVHVSLDSRGFSVAWSEVTGAFTWHRFFAIQIWLFTTFLIYVAFVEISRSLGEGGLRRLMFERRGGSRS